MPLQALAAAHDTAKAQFGKLADARSMLDKARLELEGLTKLGDMIDPEDVIKASGKLVGAGLSPLALAKLLSDMPTEGPQLQAWVAGHVQQLTAREQQLEPVLEAARHQLGLSAFRSLVGHSLLPTQAGATEASPAANPPASPASAAPAVASPAFVPPAAASPGASNAS